MTAPSPVQTIVLRALLDVHAREGRATVRDVADEAHRSLQSTHQALRALRRGGWVTWDPDTAGTLRPLCETVPFRGDRYAARPVGLDPRVRDEVFAAAGWRCTVGAASGCTGRAEHAHHRRMRSQGGSDEAENLLAVCHACHDHVHAHPAESYAAGWLIRTEHSEVTP